MVDSSSRPGAFRRAVLRPAGAWAVGAGYAGALVAVDSLTRVLSADGGAGARDWLSTDLEHLTGPVPHAVATLVGSAFVTEESVGWWALFAVAGLVVTARALGAVRTAWLAAFVHVAATLVSEGVLAARIAGGAAGADQRTILDVGPSYVVVTALVAGIAYGRRWERLAPALAFVAVAPYLFDGLAQLDVAPVGHTTSVLLALVAGGLLRWHGTRVGAGEQADQVAPVTP